MRPFGRRIRLKCITSGQGNQLALEGWSTTDRTLETSWPSHTPIALQKTSQTRSQTKRTNEEQRMITGDTKSRSAYLLGNEGFWAGRTTTQTEHCRLKNTTENIRNMN